MKNTYDYKYAVNDFEGNDWYDGDDYIRQMMDEFDISDYRDAKAIQEIEKEPNVQKLVQFILNLASEANIQFSREQVELIEKLAEEKLNDMLYHINVELFVYFNTLGDGDPVEYKGPNKEFITIASAQKYIESDEFKLYVTDSLATSEVFDEEEQVDKSYLELAYDYGASIAITIEQNGNSYEYLEGDGSISFTKRHDKYSGFIGIDKINLDWHM